MLSRRPAPLSRLLFIRSVLVATITFGVVYLLMVSWLLPQIDRATELHQHQLAHAVAGQVEALLAQPEIALRDVARRIEALPEGRPAGLDAALDKDDGFAALYVLNAEGRIVEVGLPESRRNLRDDLIGMDLSRHPLVRAVLGSSAPQWSDAALSAVSAGVSAAVAQRVGERTVIGELALAGLMGRLRGIADEGGLRTLILDRRGTIVADSSTLPTRVHQDFDESSIAAVDDERLLRFRLDGVEMVGSVMPVSPFGWKVLVIRPLADAFRPSRTAEVIMLVGLATAVILGLVGAALQAGYFARLFAELSDFARAVTEGRFERPWRSSRVSEFNELASAFDRMSGAIRERERATAASQAAYRELVESTTELAMRLDAGWRVTYANPALCALLGVRQSELFGRVLDRFLAEPGGGCWSGQSDVALTGGSAAFECMMAARSGQVRCVAWTVHAADGADGRRSYGAIGRDITAQHEAERQLQELNDTLETRVVERTEALHRSNAELSAALDDLRRTQQELISSEKMAALGSLVAGVAHELGTPLGNSLIAANTVRDHTRALRRELEAGLRRSVLERYLEDTESGNEIIERNLQRAATLVASFKQVAVDQSSSQRREFALAEVVDEIAMTLGPSIKRMPVELVTEVDGSLRLDSFPGPLGQVLANLINNAIIHAFDGRDRGVVSVRARAIGADAALVEVSDDGNGIAPDAQRRIFDPFYTTRLGKGGSGLGLHIVHNLVIKILGGTIAVDSEPGRGTTMRIRIPLRAPDAAIADESLTAG